MPSSAPSTTPIDERPALAGCPERQGVADFRAQPIAHATDPAPPADDVPGAARVQDDMDPTPLEPPSLVEAGLGPSRGDRARPEIEHRPCGGARPAGSSSSTRSRSSTPSKRRTSACTRTA